MNSLLSNIGVPDDARFTIKRTNIAVRFVALAASLAPVE